MGKKESMGPPRLVWAVVAGAVLLSVAACGKSQHQAQFVAPPASGTSQTTSPPTPPPSPQNRPGGATASPSSQPAAPAPGAAPRDPPSTSGRPPSPILPNALPYGPAPAAPLQSGHGRIWV